MSLFIHKSMVKNGQFFWGACWAPSRFKALKKLGKKYLVLRCFSISSFFKKSSHSIIRPHISFKKRLSFTQKMALLIQTGLDLPKALKLLYQQQTNPFFKKILFDLWNTLHEGWAFHEALRKYPNVFDHFYVYTIECAEKGGYLPSAFNSLADTLEFKLKIKKELQLNLIYPATIFFLGAVIFFSLLFFVIPHFEKFLLQQFSQQSLPFATKVVFLLSEIVRRYGFILIGFILFVFFTLKHFKILPEIKHIPPFNQITKSLHLGQISNHVFTMLENGIPLLEALTLSGRLSLTYEKNIRDVVAQLGNGQSLSTALKGNRSFPNFMIEMIQSAEENGQLKETFSKLSNYYLGEYQRYMLLCTKWLEPVLIIFLAILVGTLILTLFVPVFEVLQRM